MSTTVTGLQRLINVANKYITEHGLSFNPSKTSCVIFGKRYLENPTWNLNGVELKIDDELEYLGAILSKNNHSHQQKRVKSCRKGFYALQSSGLCNNGLRPEVVSCIWKTMCYNLYYMGYKVFL